MKYIAFDIGCIECGEDSGLIGVYDTFEKAQAACDEAREIQVKHWTGQHYFEVFEWDGEMDEGMTEIDGNTSDGYHTFKELYHHRMILFAALCNAYPERAWKARKHQDGSMFGKEWFITGIETPEGQYTYHYDEGWELFNVKELEFAPEWDGHQPADIERLLSLMGLHGK